MEERIKEEFCNIAKHFIALQARADIIATAIKCCVSALQSGKKILLCGNGGSAADAQHLAAELVGRYKKDRPALAAIALTVDTSILTSVANDYGYESVFTRQVEALGKPGDILIGFSTSGNSRNVNAAIQRANELGLITIGMTGEQGSRLKELAANTICVPSSVANSIQEMHIAIGHLMCDFIEQSVCHE
jgi:D-sedoheptulose 7-phosphate isomerase